MFYESALIMKPITWCICCLFTCLFVYFSVCLFVRVYLCLFINLYFYLSGFVCLSAYYLSVCSFACPLICLYIYLSDRLFVSLIICLFILVFICPSVFPSICLSVYLFIQEVLQKHGTNLQNTIFDTCML